MMRSKDDHSRNPSPWTSRFLRWFCPYYIYEEIEGDLIQKFEKDINLFGERKAKKRLVWSAIQIALKGNVIKLRAKAHCAIIFITPALMPGL